VLYLNGQPISDGLAPIVEGLASLVFTLQRTDTNKEAWDYILGSPSWTRKVAVEVSNPKVQNGQRLTGVSGQSPEFTLRVVRTPWLLAGIVIAGLAVFALCLAALRTALVRDNILPRVRICNDRSAWDAARWRSGLLLLLCRICFSGR
jgi:uncharacterized membrane protein YraQ (UPF0718 family)